MGLIKIIKTNQTIKYSIKYYIYKLKLLVKINDLRITCHTPTTAFAIRISNITSGSTKAVRVSFMSLCSSNNANT